MSVYYRGGDQAFLYWGLENIAHANEALAPGATALPAVPSLVLAGYCDGPEVSADEGAKSGHAAGSHEALYQVPGLRTYDVNVNNFRITGNGDAGSAVDFIRHGLRSSTFSGEGARYKGLSDLCLVTGATSNYEDGFSNAYRFAKCNQLSLSFQEGSAQELSASLQFMALAEGAANTLSIPVGDLQALGAPLTWHNVISWTIGNVEYRDILASCSVSVNNNLERKGVRPDIGDDNPLSRIPYALLPHLVTESFEATLHDKLPASLIKATSNSSNWGTIQIVSSNETSGAGGVTKMVTTINASRLQKRSQKGVEPSAQMSFSVTAAAAGITITKS